MNAGATLDEIIHTVRVPDALLERPYLRPVYDEPEFIVRNVWRLYGGWYDGDPARLKPAPAAALATEVAALAGGPARLAQRAGELSAAGDHRLACHLVELAVRAAPEDDDVHAVRATVYAARAETETSTMARGIFGHAAAESTDR
jgi:alkyl sulfatase BDS1-like metallo-beta-lactamase superfamily hydrolase